MSGDVDLREFDNATGWVRVETHDDDVFEVYVAGAEFDPASSFSKGYVSLTLEGAEWEDVEEAAGDPVDRAVINARQYFEIGSGTPRDAKLYAYEELESPGDSYDQVLLGRITAAEEIPEP